jgi:hypothetical protein
LEFFKDLKSKRKKKVNLNQMIMNWIPELMNRKGQLLFTMGTKLIVVIEEVSSRVAKSKELL